MYFIVNVSSVGRAAVCQQAQDVSVLCKEPVQFDKGFLRVTYHFKSARAPRGGSSSFFSHSIFLLPYMACCRGNRLENGLAFPATSGEATHADM